MKTIPSFPIGGVGKISDGENLGNNWHDFNKIIWNLKKKTIKILEKNHVPLKNLKKMESFIHPYEIAKKNSS